MPKSISVKNKRARPGDSQALKVAYVGYLLDPDQHKGTQRDWAARHGVDEATLSRWKQDDFVLDLLKRATSLMEPVWAQALAALASIAVDRTHDHCVAAVRELGKLMKKYPSEKLEVSGRMGLIDWLGSGDKAA